MAVLKNGTEYLKEKYGITDSALNTIERAEMALSEMFSYYENVAEHNTYKVIEAFRACDIQSRHFASTTGYGYADEGREKLAELFARIFGAESAIVSPHMLSGTHAITVALFGLLRPLDTMLSVTGRPYDTLSDVIGLTDKHVSGSLADFAIKYQQVDLLPTGNIDIHTAIDNIRLNKSIKMVYIQRSRGYELRPAISVEQIKQAIKSIREKCGNIKIVVDNCYGEFTEYLEPTDVGADLMIGSLIKNPGSGIAPTGGYLAGTKECIDLCASRLTTPSTGMEIGSNFAGYLPYFMGIYHAPHAVKNAIKGVCLASYIYEQLGYLVNPRYDFVRSDITQAICFRDKNELIEFIRAVQKASPVDSNAVPYPWEMPGYEDEVIMAAGTFIQGASIELSADAPIRPPYTAYMQGGVVYENVKLALLIALSERGAL